MPVCVYVCGCEPRMCTININNHSVVQDCVLPGESGHQPRTYAGQNLPSPRAVWPFQVPFWWWISRMFAGPAGWGFVCELHRHWRVDERWSTHNWLLWLLSLASMVLANRSMSFTTGVRIWPHLASAFSADWVRCCATSDTHWHRVAYELWRWCV